MVESFFHNNIKILNYLIKNNRSNCRVIALVLTEMYFNRSYKRILEYLAYFVLPRLLERRLERLSVGISQVQIRHWKNLGYISLKPRFSDIRIMTNVLVNYDIAVKLIGPMATLNTDNSKLLAIYRGESRAYHLKIFNQLFILIKGYCN